MSNYTDNQVIEDSNHVWNKLANLIPSGSKVLDIGCSSGNFGEFLIRQKACQVDGVEPDKKDADIASQKLGKVWSFFIDDPANVAQIKGKYDVLVFADVLEHLVHPDEVLKLVKQLVNPGGRVVFSVPNMAHISVRLSLLNGDFKYTETGLLDKTHLHFYDNDTVEALFSDAGMVLADLDAVIYRYPDSLIKKQLNKLGFTANKSGLETLNSPSATTFQYIGSASYSKKTPKHAPLPNTALSQDLQVLVDDLGEKEKDIKNRDSLIKKKNADIVDLKNRLNDIEQSRSYKVTQKVTATIRSGLRLFRS